MFVLAMFEEAQRSSEKIPIGIYLLLQWKEKKRHFWEYEKKLYESVWINLVFYFDLKTSQNTWMKIRINMNWVNIV